VYKCLHGLAPQYLSELCVPVADIAGRRQLCSASRGLLYFPRYNMTTYGRRAFSYAGPHAWNLLPENMLNSTSMAIFKRSLRHFYSSRLRIQRIRDDLHVMGYTSVISNSNSNSNLYIMFISVPTHQDRPRRHPIIFVLCCITKRGKTEFSDWWRLYSLTMCGQDVEWKN